MKIRLFLIAVAVIVSAGLTFAEVRLPSSISDGMVLQQQTEANLWGWAEAGSTVSVTPSWSTDSYECVAGKDGKWILKVATPSAGGPFALHFSDGNGIRTVSDVMVGEVWICSGQSNMAMKLRGNPGQPVANSLEEIMHADRYRDRIRVLNMDLVASKELCDDIPGGRWEKCSSEKAWGFSAVGYYFAKNLTENLGVPVGIIVNAWGGSKIEAWLDSETTAALKNEDNPEDTGIQKKRNLIFNSMVYPIINYTAKGFLWYQGESNRDNPEMYARQMPAMVAKWRKLWNDDTMPFYFAQIAHFNYKDINGDVVPEFVNMQQSLVGEIPYSGIVGTTDIGELACIHPAAKDKVGFRFAHMALNECYGRYGDSGIPSTGPAFTKIEKAKNGILVYFDQTLAPVLDGVLGFEVEYKDGSSAKVAAKVSAKSDAVLLSVPRSDEAVAVKYAYRNYIESNLLNIYGLPAFPFRKEIE